VGRCNAKDDALENGDTISSYVLVGRKTSFRATLLSIWTQSSHSPSLHLSIPFD